MQKNDENNRFYTGTIISSTSLHYKEVYVGNKGMDMGVCELKFVFYTDKIKEEIYHEFDEMKNELSKRLAAFNITGGSNW